MTLLLLPLAAAQSTVTIERLSAGHRTIATSIEIEAPPEAVWAVMTDFEAMPGWSSSLQSVEGELRDGGEVSVRFKPDPDKDRVNTYQHHLIYEEGVSFGWQGDVFAAGMTDNHRYRLVDLGDGRTRLEHSDEARGGMTWLLGGAVMKAFEGFCTSFNQELKERVESTWVPPEPEPELAPRPLSLGQLRAGLPTGTTIRLSLQPAGAPPTQELWEFVASDDAGTTIRSTSFDEAGEVVAGPEEARSSWEELWDHAAFPAAATTIEDEALELPLGSFDTHRYTVTRAGDEGATVVDRFWFAEALPGPPLRYVSEVDGEEVFRMEQLERGAP